MVNNRMGFALCVSIAVWELADANEQRHFDKQFQVTVSSGKYAVDGEPAAALTLWRGKSYLFTVDGPDYHTFAFAKSRVGPGLSTSSSSYMKSDVNICPDWKASRGNLTLVLDDSTPDQIFYGCLDHSDMGGSINVRGNAPTSTSETADATATGFTSAAAICANTNTTFVVTSGASHRYLLALHGCLMFSAFGMTLPVGTLLAHIGKHKYHVCVQPTGVLLGVIGIGFAIAYVEKTHGSHFSKTHHIVGIVIIIAAAIVQPFAIFNGFHNVHHKNGALVVGFGIVNCFLGMGVYGARMSLQYAFGVWVAALAVMWIFDPLSLREAQEIKTMEKHRRGEEYLLDPLDIINENLIDLGLKGNAHAHANGGAPLVPPQSRAGWEQNVNTDAGIIRFRRPTQNKE